MIESTGANAPDETETEVISVTTKVVEQAVAEHWLDKKWTYGILNALGQIGKRRGYVVCGPGGDYGEWLYDMTWWVEGERVSVPLVLESEWGVADWKIDPDFQKLLVARADHRVMIFHGNDIERHFARMIEHVRSFAYTAAGDRYLLLGFDWGTSRIKSRVFVA